MFHPPIYHEFIFKSKESEKQNLLEHIAGKYEKQGNVLCSIVIKHDNTNALHKSLYLFYFTHGMVVVINHLILEGMKSPIYTERKLFQSTFQ